MIKQEQAEAKRARKAARGPGFSNYGRGAPTPHTRKAKPLSWYVKRDEERAVRARLGR